jgi:hypothetical protein
MQAVIAAKRAKNNDFNFELVTISPQLARQWLDQNHNNRKLKKRFVATLAGDIASGNWRITGDSIKFGPDGSLLDGQHRLAACIAADKPITSLVIYGVPPDAKVVMDTGKARSPSDVLAMNGHKNTNALTTAYRLLINERKCNVLIGGASFATNAEIMAAASKHPRMPLYVPMPGTFPHGISIGLVGYVRYVGSTFCGHAIEGDEMVEVLKTGVPSYDGDAIHAWREKVIHSYAESVAGVGGRVATIQTFKWCWNKFVAKEPVTRLRWVQTDVAINRLNLKDL